MQKTKLSTRTLSLLLAVLTVLGILPSSIMMASAGDPIPPPSTSQLATIKLESANDDGTLKNPPPMPAEIRLDKYYQVSSESGSSYGKYHISTLNRIKAPEGYDIDQPDTQTLTLKKGQTKAYFTFTDTKHGEIIIRKFKEGTTKPLPGAEFKVVIDGNELGSYTTGPEGEIHITSDDYSTIWDGNAETHSVTVTETKAPAGYLKSDPDTQTLMMNKGQKFLEFSFYDKPYADILLITRKIRTGREGIIAVPDACEVFYGVEVGGQQNAVNQSTQHISNTGPYSSTGAIIIVDADLQNGDGSAAMSGNSSAWTTDTELWTAQVVNPSVKNAPVSTNYVPSSDYMPSYIPMNLPATDY